jgi:alpha-ketoglutarate-dependent 2,4-dichlorophenoxyacetate dioxygenase
MDCWMVEPLSQGRAASGEPAPPSQRAAEMPFIGPRLSPAGGVVIGGIDLSRPISPTEIARILEAFRKHHIVVFREQVLSREQQFAFSANFGEVEHSSARKSQPKRYAVAHVISNLDEDGNPVDRSSSPVSNYNWHTDKPYYPAPPMMTTLYAVETPPEGGDTEFANTGMAFSALSTEMKRQLAELRVAFCWGARRPEGDHQMLAVSDRQEFIDHPLVRTHPETGVKALYLGNHASHIVGWPVSEGRALLDRLLAHTTRRHFVYTHRWRVGDLVMWDNRCLLHRVVANFQMDKERRVLHRTVVRGSVPA